MEESMPVKTSNESIKELLVRIKQDIQALYPFTAENSEPDMDSRYCFALGFIFGIALEGLESVRQNRTIHLSNIGFKDAVTKNPGALMSLDGDAREGNEP